MVTVHHLMSYIHSYYERRYAKYKYMKRVNKAPNRDSKRKSVNSSELRRPLSQKRVTDNIKHEP